MKEFHMNALHIIRNYASLLKAKVAEQNNKPDFAAIAADGGTKMGAAWLRTADDGAAYIEVSLDHATTGAIKIVENKRKRRLW
jgi:uncharacterized protein (DUF736 family)